MSVRRPEAWRRAARAAAVAAITVVAGVAGIPPVAQAADRVAIAPPRRASAPLEFEENRGQFDARVSFVGRGAGTTVFLTPTEAVYVLPMPGDDARRVALRMQFVGANPRATLAGEQPTGHRTNWFVGADPARWRTNVPSFGRVRHDDVYDGVAMVWQSGAHRATRYDFEVAPGADASRIALRFAGADRVETDADGALLLHTAAGVVRHAAPVAYQEHAGARRAVASRFRVADGVVGFEVGAHDRSRTLVIDPTVDLTKLGYSTLLGGDAIDLAHGITVDAHGNAFVVGSSTSLTFPATAGVFQSTHTNEAVFVSKLNAVGSELVWSTFLEGNGNDLAFSVVTDSTGRVYVSGFTTSSDFPTTAANAFDASMNGSQDVFVSALSADGAQLLYSTFLGGGSLDQGLAMVSTAPGAVAVAGRTSSSNFPLAGVPFDSVFNNAVGIADAFVARVDTTLSGAASLTYSTYLGGTAADIARGIGVDAAGSLHVAGETTSTDFPVSGGAFDTTPNGNLDAFVTKLSVNGQTAVYSTYLGGDGADVARALAVDATGQAVVVGSAATGAVVFPTSANGFDSSANGGLDVFVVKLSTSGTTLAYGTLLGGNGAEEAFGVAVDALGVAHVTGYTNDSSADYPTTGGAFDAVHNGVSDVFVTKLRTSNPTQTLVYSTLFGSSVDDTGEAIALDRIGNVYVAGSVDLPTGATIPTTVGVLQPSYSGGASDGFVAKFGNFAVAGRVIDTETGGGMADVTVSLSGSTADFVETVADGHFGFVDTLDDGTYVVAASRPGYSMNPSSFGIAALDGNRELIFLAQPGPPVAPLADLSIAKSDGVTQAVAGGSVTYTTLVSNLGANDTTGARVADAFPAELACSWTCVGVGGGDCGSAGTGDVDDAATLPVGGSAIYTANCAVSVAASGTLTNTATVATPDGVVDPVPSNNSSTDVDTVVPNSVFGDGFEN